MPSFLFTRYRGYFPEVKLPGGDDHSPPSIFRVKNVWSYTSAPLVCLYGVDGFLHLVHINQATRRHNLIVHSSTDRNWRFEFPTQKSGIFCAWVLAVVTSWDAGVSLSLSLIPRCYLCRRTLPPEWLWICARHTLGTKHVGRFPTFGTRVKAVLYQQLILTGLCRLWQTVGGRIVLERTASCWDTHNFINIILFSLL